MLRFLGISAPPPPPSVDDVTHAPGGNGHVSDIRGGAAVRVGGRGEDGFRGGDRRHVGGGGPRLVSVVNNLLLTNVADFLGTFLLGPLLLHSLIFVFASRKRNYTPIITLAYNCVSCPVQRTGFVTLKWDRVIKSYHYFLLYLGLHFFSGISVLVGRHFWSI